MGKVKAFVSVMNFNKFPFHAENDPLHVCKNIHIERMVKVLPQHERSSNVVAPVYVPMHKTAEYLVMPLNHHPERTL